MRFGNILALILLLSTLFITGYLFVDKTFFSSEIYSTEIENHLSDIVEIKTSRINDYFLERTNDIIFLSNTQEIKDLLISPTGPKPELISLNIDKQLEIISKQIKIYLDKYPTLTLSDLQSSEDFQNLVLQKIGNSGSVVLVDYNSNNKNIILGYNQKLSGLSFTKNNQGFYTNIKNTNLKTSDGFLIGITALAYMEDFKVLDQGSRSLQDNIDVFKEVSGYDNLMLVSSSGHIIYQSVDTLQLGSNLLTSDSILSDIYSKRNNYKPNSIYGPFYDVNSDPTILSLSFLSKVYDKNNNYLGSVILIDKMDEINRIAHEEINLGTSGEAFIVDKDFYLITSLKSVDFDLLIQKVESQNIHNCYNPNIKKSVSYFQNFKGDDVIGSYGFIPELNWCIVAEINQNEVIDSQKQLTFKTNLIAFTILVILFISLSIYTKSSLTQYHIHLKKTVSKVKTPIYWGAFIFIFIKILSFGFNPLNITFLLLSLFGILLMYKGITNLGGRKK